MPVGTVIIVSYNSAQHIESCLQAIADEDSWDILLVDNSSRDDSVQRARRALPRLQVIANTANRGFAGALNQAAAIAQGEIFLVLNPDAVATPGALAKLAETLRQNSVGAVGGLLVKEGNGPEEGFTVRRFPTLGSMLAELLLVNRIWPSNPWNRRYRCLNLDYSKLQEVEQPAGACLAVNRRIWDRLCGFDDRFFPVWFEDVDFCRRLHELGQKILYCPDAVFRHSGAHSVSRLPFKERQSFWYGNMLRYFRKHHAGWEVAIVRIGIVAGMTLRCALSLFGQRPTGRPLWEMLAGYGHVIWQYGFRTSNLNSRKKSPAVSSAVL